MSRINPPNAPIVMADGRVDPVWYRFFVAIQSDVAQTSTSVDDASIFVSGSVGASLDDQDGDVLLLERPFTIPTLEEVLDGASLSGVSHGTATIDFGAFPGSNEASVAFADAAVSAGSVVKAWFTADSVTADHTANDHKYAPVFINLTALPTAGVGGTIYARSEEKMQGQWLVNWEWS